LERSLPQVSSLTPENWPANSPIRINEQQSTSDNTSRLCEQAKELIYVNAFCGDVLVPSWRERFVFISDGGTCCWQAL
jgi:hypothetical protein